MRAGLCLGLTSAADQHGLLVCGIVALLTVARRPRDAFSFAMGALAIVAIVFGGVWAMGGRHLWQSLVGVHLHHLRIGQGVGSQFWDKFTRWIYEHVYLIVGAGLAVVLLGARRAEAMIGEPRPTSSRIVRVLLLVVGAHIAVVAAMTEADRVAWNQNVLQEVEPFAAKKGRLCLLVSKAIVVPSREPLVECVVCQHGGLDGIPTVAGGLTDITHGKAPFHGLVSLALNGRVWADVEMRPDGRREIARIVPNFGKNEVDQDRSLWGVQERVRVG